jgi:adenylate kinase
MKSGSKQILIFMGPPGSGKGTQTDLLSEYLKIPAVSTGELLRLEMKHHTKIGEAVRKNMDAGILVSDEVVKKVMEKRLAKDDTKNGFILDGFPRHLKQIDDLKGIIKEFHADKKDLLVFYIYLYPAETKKRLGRRRVCNICGRTYHLDINPPQVKGICDDCGSKLDHRKDDEPEAVARRLRNFHQENDPLIDYFSQQGVLYRIDGKQSIEKVQKDILKDLKKHVTHST